MAFASKFSRMLFFASCVAPGAAAFSGGCIATNTIEFDPAENFPPSVVSEPNADFPLNRIGQINLDDLVETPEMPLQVIPWPPVKFTSRPFAFGLTTRAATSSLQSYTRGLPVPWGTSP